MEETFEEEIVFFFLYVERGEDYRKLKIGQNTGSG